MVFIGEQASGKSTICKAVYFFRTLKTELMECLEEYEDGKELSVLKKELGTKIRRKFKAFFGFTSHDFEIHFWYSPQYDLKITPDDSGSVIVSGEAWFRKLDGIVGEWRLFLQKKKASNLNGQKKSANRTSLADSLLGGKMQAELRKIEVELERKMMELFGENDSLEKIFIPAGRSFLAAIQRRYEVEWAQSVFSSPMELRTGSSLVSESEDVSKYYEFFVRQFISDTLKIKKEVFYGKTLEAVIDEFETLRSEPLPIDARQLLKQIEKIIKASYRLDDTGERLILQNRKSVLLEFASSGQQEAIWILLLLFFLSLTGRPASVIIEEPEAHLFPKAQQEMVKFLALFLKVNPKNQIMVTTHSPYLLTAFNNLLMAGIVQQQNPGAADALEEIIGQAAWLDPDMFDAFLVQEDGSIRSIVSKETKLIAETELDAVSDELMDTFDHLLELYSDKKEA